MYRYKRLMVGVSFTDTDLSAIQYAAMISRLAKSEHVSFVHVVRNFESLKSIHEEYPQLLEPIEEFTKTQMRTEVSKYFDGPPEITMEYEVVEGSPLLQLLNLARRREIDLLVIGKGPICREDVKLPVKLARKAPCSVLVVPQKSVIQINNILVPIDFSDNAKDAMEVGINIASAAGKTTIACVNTYSVPSGYQKTGKTYEEFAAIMKEHAEKHSEEFLSQIDYKGISVTPLFTLDDHTAQGIEKTIEANQIDLVVVGARGRETFAGLLLGSITRALIKLTSIPLLAVKKKTGGMTFIEALRNL